MRTRNNLDRHVGYSLVCVWTVLEWIVTKNVTKMLHKSSFNHLAKANQNRRPLAAVPSWKTSWYNSSVAEPNYFLRFQFQLLKSYGSGSSSDFWKVTVPVPTDEKLGFRLQFRLSFQIIQSSFQTKILFCKKPCLFDVNWSSFVDQIHNFILCLWELCRLFYYSSGTVINYGSGSGSGSSKTEIRFGLRFRFRQKVTVPTVPVPQHCFTRVHIIFLHLVLCQFSCIPYLLHIFTSSVLYLWKF